ncbi:recombinase family protein [Streptomyces hundungensis]|uniref:recombinase family protein n=1 Tax=Streptomyces hundungensis TaxID=1077946 RepID=UPI00340D3170
MFSEKISTRVRVRPQFEAALALARQIKAHAPHCRVIFTVYEMKRLGRDAAELTALADHLTAHGLVLEMLAGPLPGMYDPSGPGRLLFAFFAAMAETERENIRESTLEVLDTAAHKGKHGGRPPVITEDMLHTVLRRRANGESVEQIQPDLIIPTGKRKGQAPSVASIYRALAEHEKKEAYPEAVEAAHTDFADLQDANDIPRPRRPASGARTIRSRRRKPTSASVSRTKPSSPRRPSSQQDHLVAGFWRIWVTPLAPSGGCRAGWRCRWKGRLPSTGRRPVLGCGLDGRRPR